MESFIGTIGGLAILLVIGFSIAFAAIVIFKLGKRSQEPGFKGVKKCLICGSPMEPVSGSSYLVRCSNPKCPNNSIT
ncbi:MAG: hypothetical protein PHO26_02490 [Dehalococcoidia bacterium]|nr:hypothetical protein [Dehalococcoidia bacterium]MDD5494152.1 hypothetical protein [Dehalococcoidia bacterium]